MPKGWRLPGAAAMADDLSPGMRRFTWRIARIGGKCGTRQPSLQLINERIRFIRWIDMGSRATKTKGEHSAILDAVEARDAARAGNLMSGHISRRMDQIVAAVREGYSSIYMEGPEQVFGRRVTEAT